MITAVVLGLGTGLGLAMLAAYAFPPRLTLAQAFAVLHPPTTGRTIMVRPVIAPDEAGRLASVGRPFVPLLVRLGLPRASVRADLGICGREPARHLAEQAAMALLGLLIPPAFAALVTLGGTPIGWQLPVWASLILAALGMFVPDLALASEAVKRRAELRNAVSAMLDLVVISLAGGAGVEQALRDATDDAEGWAQQALRQAVEAAHLRRRPPWQTLGELGETTGMTALAELSAALSMAGSEGARIKATLSARSAALMTHQLAEAEAAAASATERMVLPLVLLLGGFMIFLMFPAFATILGAF
ncbi:type II secretion system F family protein [Micromonospora sp. NPDC051925]|uniref:Flp pilus assembly protein TadB n=1 Tax=Micromonospora matsumotoense TaxID=121616 RepID=A0A1C4TWK1_9ACTN|nr:type II secretion system F family protein [Micromonospora matsumotoense]SCE63812.1 Flp pilus assembly protein TadB [Micromonospora matsumotoense]